MGAILGIGATHYPPGLVPEELKPWPLARMLKNDPRIPEHMKDPANWPEPMRREWGDDEGVASHKVHKARVFDAFRKIRREIEAFEPDLIVMWGDDQYENFKEDIIPPFCVLAYEQLVFKPYERLRGKPNIWGEPADKVFTHPGHHQAGRYLARRLLEEGIDMSYAYKPLHEDGLGHAFANTLLYLDLDRKGFRVPVVPVAVNCYGSSVIRFRGGFEEHSKEPDPPSPSPRRCFEMGQATARVLRESPWRVVLMASSSWSHGFLTEKNHWMYPDLHAACADGSRGPAGSAQLDLPRRRDGGVERQGEHPRLGRDLDVQRAEMPGGFQERASGIEIRWSQQRPSKRPRDDGAQGVGKQSRKGVRSCFLPVGGPVRQSDRCDQRGKRQDLTP
jgi:hypothetical protein